MRTTSGKDWIWEPTRWAIYARDGFACVACGKPKPDGDAPRRDMLSVDHVRPGGGNSPRNLVTLCGACNSSKGARSFGTWRPEHEAKVRKAVRRALTPQLRAEGRRLAAIARPGRLEANRAAARRRASPAYREQRAVDAERCPF